MLRVAGPRKPRLMMAPPWPSPPLPPSPPAPPIASLSVNVQCATAATVAFRLLRAPPLASPPPPPARPPRLGPSVGSSWRGGPSGPPSPPLRGPPPPPPPPAEAGRPLAPDRRVSADRAGAARQCCPGEAVGDGASLTRRTA